MTGVLTVTLPGVGAHPAAPREPPGAIALDWFRHLAVTAERGGIDLALFGHDPWGPALARHLGLPRFDPLPLIVALADSTRGIGLGAALTLDHAEPFNVARSFAAADRLTAGRAAWITAVSGRAENAGDFAHGAGRSRAERYARGEECIAVARKLWDSWEDGAVILDKAAGLFSDPALVHRIEHAGPWFSVRGPLNAPRPLQGHPVVVQWDASPEGLALAGRTADLFIADHAEPARLRSLPTRRLASLTVLLAATQDEAEARAAGLDAAVAGPLAAAIRADDRDADPVRAAWCLAGTPFIGTAEGLAAVIAGLGPHCEGVNIVPAVLPLDLERFVADVVPLLPVQRYGATLRATLGLARPRSQFAS